MVAAYIGGSYEDLSTWPTVVGYLRVRDMTSSPRPGTRALTAPVYESLVQHAAPFRFFAGQYEVPTKDGVCRWPGRVVRAEGGELRCYKGAPLTTEEQAQVDAAAAAAAREKSEREADMAKSITGTSDCGPKLFTKAELISRGLTSATDASAKVRWYYDCKTGKVTRYDMTQQVVKGWDTTRPWVVGALLVAAAVYLVRRSR
jgi:hypothetical protein